MTRSVYLLAFIASATVVSARDDLDSHDRTSVCRPRHTVLLRTSIHQRIQRRRHQLADQTEADCNGALLLCYTRLAVFSESMRLGNFRPINNHNSRIRQNLAAHSARVISQHAEVLPSEGKTSLTTRDPTAVGQTKAACEAAGSSCVWSYKEDKSPATDDHKCHANTNSWMAVYTANNIPAPYKAYYQWVHYVVLNYLRTTHRRRVQR